MFILLYVRTFSLLLEGLRLDLFQSLPLGKGEGRGYHKGRPELAWAKPELHWVRPELDWVRPELD